MNKNRIHIATFSENAEETAKRYGYGLELDHLCISENLDEENLKNTLDQMKSSMEAAGIESPERLIIHGPFTELMPCAIDRRARELARERHLQSVEVCRKLRVKKLILHSGWIPSMYFPSWQVEKSVEYWKSLAECLAEDFVLCIENVFEPEPDTLIDIIDGVNDPRIRICLDMGHANAAKSAGTAEDWIERMGSRIGHFHIHNNDGTRDSHQELDRGEMDMKRLLTLAEKVSPEATFTIESRKCEASARWLEAYMEDRI